MRHQVRGRHLSRTSAHRKALRRNLAASLFEHGTISTTCEKAKFVKPFAEKLITLAKDGSLHARRRAIAMLNDRAICKVENDEPVHVTTVIRRLFSEIGPRFAERQGGYTRIISLPLRRIGDNGRLVLLQLVEEQIAAAKPKAAPVVDAAPAPAPEVTAEPEQKISDASTDPDDNDSEASTDTDAKA